MPGKPLDHLRVDAEYAAACHERVAQVVESQIGKPEAAPYLDPPDGQGPFRHWLEEGVRY